MNREPDFWKNLTLEGIKEIKDHQEADEAYGLTPLMSVLAIRQSPDVIKKMIELSPNAKTAKDHIGRTALFYIYSDNVDAAADLLQDCGDYRSLEHDIYHNNFFQYVLKNKQYEVVLAVLKNLDKNDFWPPFKQHNGALNLSELFEFFKEEIHTWQTQKQKDDFPSVIFDVLEKHGYDESALKGELKKYLNDDDMLAFLEGGKHSQDAKPQKAVVNTIQKTPVDVGNNNKPQKARSSQTESDPAPQKNYDKTKEGAVVDRGTHFESLGFTDKKLEATQMVQAAIQSDWTSVVIDGDEEYVQFAIEIAIESGIEVMPKDEKQLKIIEKAQTLWEQKNQSTEEQNLEPESKNTIGDSGNKPLNGPAM